jgi:hypothetical protein
VSWYLRVPTETVFSADQLGERVTSKKWGPLDVLLLDTEFTRNLGCRPMPAVGISSAGAGS